MKVARYLVFTGSAGLAVAFMAAPGAASAGVRPGPQRLEMHGSLVTAKERTHPDGAIPRRSPVEFDMVLRLRNAAGAAKFVRAVSSPGSATFHHYLTLDKWLTRFGPTKAEVRSTVAWLRKEGFTVGAIPKDRLIIPATGTAARVERAFDVRLGYYKVNGHKVRLAKNPLSIPSSLNGSVTGVSGVNEFLATTDLSYKGTGTAAPDQEPGPPTAFVNPQPCSAYWGQKTDTADSGSLYSPYDHPLPYDICGYKPQQLRGGYKLNSTDNGAGVGIAIVDAYDSPTLFSDAHRYFQQNDAAEPLSAGQFFNDEPATIDDQAECGASGWFDEQSLDVEASHAMAPDADILFVGAQDCTDTGLLAAENTAITSGASVVTNSWGDTMGDLFDDVASHTAYDNTFMLADSTGVSILFSSGDSGDNFADFGLAVPNYPATSPFVTAVGGTTLEVGAGDTRSAEYGWSTAKQVLCTPAASTNCGSATSPTGSLAWQAGGGGGTSYYYTQPYYQAGIVPSALALRNEALFGPVPLRVIPDIAMDADAQSGMLIGLTETFPHGVHYGQFKEGGTSLASPLLAGIVADADSKAGVSLGFLNPELYKASTINPAAFNDILAPSDPDATAVIRVDYANTIDSSDGYVVSLRAIDYEGPETYCDGTGNCATRDVTLNAAPGFDSLTGLGSIGKDFFQVMAKF